MKYIKTIFLLLSTFLFISCGENTKNQITPDIISINIDDANTTTYSTDAVINLNATVTYDDQTSLDTTDFVNWSSSNDSINIINGQYYAISNGGESNISINYEHFSDSVSVKVYGLKEGTLVISSADINTTGVHTLEAQGEFIDIDTNTTMDTNRTIIKNIVWSVDEDSDAVITIEDDIVTIEINAGDTNVTATVFDMNVTKTYFIN